METARMGFAPLNVRTMQWLLFGGLFILLYSGVLPKWGLDLWEDPNYSHGLLIPFISIYLVRERLLSLSDTDKVRQSNWAGLVVVFAALVMFIIGSIGAEFFTKRISLIVLLFGALWLLEGWKITKELSFPVGLLFFAVPLPYVLYNSMAFPLKLLASKIAVKLLGVIGMPVFLEGNVITLPHTTLEVVDACSGIRSLMTLITLAFLLAYFHHKQTWKRLVVLSLAIPVAVAANAVRVAATGILTKYDQAWGHGTLHDFEGWLVFVASFAGLAVCSYLLRSKEKN